ncbi:Transmembrane 9 superfamily member 2 [Trichinella zimbabwensis]|uniref:Transmembrane 9 superfamily member n=1 Tax=Trichinella zimbabwensis TaxID=268475 RepID=A0A0V1HNT0_9BILA|nr:Transmembrane 9 superfamily member 2 [Trichinella zimbabwensis]
MHNYTFIILLLLKAAFVNPFYLPGLTPVNFCPKEMEKPNCKSDIKVYVNRLNSKNTILDYEYHDFDFCLGNEDEDTPVENLGQVLFGERIRPSPYKIKFLKNETCRLLCSKFYDGKVMTDVRKLRRLKHGITKGYYHHWIVDNLPVTFCVSHGICFNGFPMGTTSLEIIGRSSGKNGYGEVYLFNHVDFIIEYRDLSHDPNYFDDPVGGRIISVKVVPSSINHIKEDSLDCDNSEMLSLNDNFHDMKIIYTYSVKFLKTDIKWASRWDYILNSKSTTSIQWFGITNSILIVLFLTGMIGVIFLRTLRRDISRYNQFDSSDDIQEEFGWKLVHGDVFRPPACRLLLSVFLGSGAQILCMAFVTLVLACLGFLSPARRGALMTCGVVLYICFGFVNGYVSATFYKAFGGTLWKKNIFLSAVLCPGIIFAGFFLCNIILWSQSSSAAIPFSTLLLLLFLWFGVSTPLTYLGAFIAFQKSSWSYPVRTNQIPRQIPPQPFFSKPLPATVMAGILPFGSIYVQMFFMFNSLWAHLTYYMFGFLFVVYLILLVTISETSIILCYFQLCGEDYRWWWRAFFSSAFTAFYLLVYSIYFYLYKLTIVGVVSTVLYFSYCLIFVFIFFIMCDLFSTGTVGFVSCFWFVRQIYSVVKVD